MARWDIALPLEFVVVRKVEIEHVGAEGYILEKRLSEHGIGSSVNSAKV
jgi:hypothetical protein